ncbi:DUF6801 domain-containing protein [Janibacter sp. GS2]|uniref:DUF6801 domain-containing protein n=1 Tax=Janibacter sp. GS2 TaxID=3442646 RepID=UPI003EB70E67
MSHRLKTRLSAGAALVTGLGMIGIASAAPAHAALSSDLDYTCALTNEGLESNFEDPWAVNLSVDVPDQVEQGASIEAPEITATVVPGDDAAERLRSLNVATVEGTAEAMYSVGDNNRTASLTIPTTDVPASGDITNVATGTGEAETAPEEDTDLDVVAGDFTTDLTTDSGFVLNIACTAPEDGAIGSITVGEGSGEEPTDPEPTDPEPTDPEPTDPEPTDPGPTDPEPTNPGPTDPEPANPEPTNPEPANPEPADPEVPAVVQTDGAATAGAGDNPAGLALGGLLLAGAGAGAVVVARRKATQH